MSGESTHLGEILGDLLDGRLSPEERARAEAHVAGCEQCRRELEAARWAKEAAHLVAGAPVPAVVEAAVFRALDQEERAGGVARRTHAQWRPWGPALAFGIVAVAAIALLLWRPWKKPDLPRAVAQDYSAYARASLPLEIETRDTQKVEEFFAARGVPFETRVFDLAMMGFQVVGGRVHVLSGRTSALFVYQGADGQILLCEMFEGSLADLPPPAEVRGHNGIRFAIHSLEGTTMVFWEEGPVVCVLVSRMNPEDVIQLAFAKAVKT